MNKEITRSEEWVAIREKMLDEQLATFQKKQRIEAQKSVLNFVNLYGSEEVNNWIFYTK